MYFIRLPGNSGLAWRRSSDEAAAAATTLTTELFSVRPESVVLHVDMGSTPPLQPRCPEETGADSRSFEPLPSSDRSRVRLKVQGNHRTCPFTLLICVVSFA